MCIRPLAQLELPVILRRCRVDADRRQPSNVVCPAARIDDMNSLLAGVEAVFDEREQNPIVVVGAVEESADVAFVAKNRASEPNRAAVLGIGIVAVGSA